MSDTTWAAAQNILCVQLNTMSHVLAALPAIRALKAARPGRRLTLLTSPTGAALAPLLPEIDECISYDLPWAPASPAHAPGLPEYALAARLGDRGFDGAVIFTAAGDSALPAAALCALAGIPRRLAYCREEAGHLLTDYLREPKPDRGGRDEAQRQLELVAVAGCPPPQAERTLHVPEAARRYVRTLLAKGGLDGARRWIVAHPGTPGPAHYYPVDAFAEVVRGLAVEHGYTVVFTGTPDEQERVDSIRFLAGVRTRSLVGALSLAELAALLERAPLLLANTAGLGALAGRLGTPVVALGAQGRSRSLMPPAAAVAAIQARVASAARVAGLELIS